MNPQTGYIFNFQAHGAFAPDGKVADAMPQEDIDAHNRKLAAQEVEEMKQTGRAVLYLHKRKDSIGTPGQTWEVGTWEGSFRVPVYYSQSSWHNMAGKDGRLDVWFTFDGSRWHGVNIGDNDIVRCRRTKGSK